MHLLIVIPDLCDHDSDARTRIDAAAALANRMDGSTRIAWPSAEAGRRSLRTAEVVAADGSTDESHFNASVRMLDDSSPGALQRWADLVVSM